MPETTVEYARRLGFTARIEKGVEVFMVDQRTGTTRWFPNRVNAGFFLDGFELAMKHYFEPTAQEAKGLDAQPGLDQ